jgi:hypothetical protein
MTKTYSKGAKVEWNWGQGKATGKVIKSSLKKIQKTIKGSKIIRNGTPQNPAYLIEQENGAQVLKLHSELTSIKDI